MTAAELVYHLIKKSGTVAEDKITFVLEEEKRIEISLLGGHYSVYDKDSSKPIATGRKAFELLMELKKLSYENSIKWLVENFNIELAENLATDYLKMILDSYR